MNLARPVATFVALASGLAGRLARPAAEARWPVLLAFLLLPLLIFGIGTFAYRQQEALILQDVAADLGTETDYKAAMLADQQAHRSAVTRLLAADPLLRGTLGDWIRERDPGRRQVLEQFLQSAAQGLGLEHARLLDPAGRNLLGEQEPGAPTAHRAAIVAEAAAATGVAFVDLHSDSPGQPLHLALAAPVRDARDSGVLIAVLVLEVDATRELFPAVQDRILESRTGEAFLVRPVGPGANRRIEFLTPLRYRDPATALAAPDLAWPASPLASILAGDEHLLRGPDYRGVTVLARGARVRGTPWYVVTQVDEAEALAPLQRTAWFIAVLLVRRAHCACCWLTTFSSAAGCGARWTT